jgi:hypothetical protein
MLVVEHRGPLGGNRKISGTSDVNSWTKPGATYSNLIDRAGFAAIC